MVYEASFLYVNQVSIVFISFHVILFPKLSYLNDLAPFGSIWYFGIWTEFLHGIPCSIGLTDLESS